MAADTVLAYSRCEHVCDSSVDGLLEVYRVLLHAFPILLLA